MTSDDRTVKIFSGKEILVYSLKARLEENQISAMIRNDSLDNFLRGTPAAIDLYIRQADLKRANPVLKEFLSKNQ
jgi:hypothetical protein